MNPKFPLKTSVKRRGARSQNHIRTATIKDIKDKCVLSYKIVPLELLISPHPSFIRTSLSKLVQHNVV